MKLLLTLFYGLIFTLPLSMHAASLNGFTLDRLTVPVEQILSGGPGKDGIPAIIKPNFVDASKARFLKGHDIVLGLTMNGKSRAYPIKILNWHEVVNDSIDGRHFVISYCPLCGSGMAFLASPGKQILTFGVSGLLYNSDVLMYDHQTESLWSQIRGKAISGAASGTSLTQYPLKLTRWKQWLKDHPDTKVLSTKTGFYRSYSQDPYAGYSRTPRLYFPVANQAPSTYSVKETVLGYKGSKQNIAFPFSELRKHDQEKFRYQFEGKQLTIHWDSQNQSAWISDSTGQQLSSTMLYWFAWYAFYPDTKIFKAGK
ncbi:DUF3179 domain-containing protein [Photobacterium alginatilyticum]|uniref:DUF3179 domain-containing protein n=1 Tax=Photobacterium alginatilyticum TaxID=1775171 RepID=A0ABW9YHL6_9GAMM|nr:DUF3179 domain-containing protein [Photobacterium alginatilyticum]NBI53307.1 DUF3179 domain-containing protein [Photobacterium alginatilyticum]